MEQRSLGLDYRKIGVYNGEVALTKAIENIRFDFAESLGDEILIIELQSGHLELWVRGSHNKEKTTRSNKDSKNPKERTESGKVEVTSNIGALSQHYHSTVLESCQVAN